jgi:NTP pyrophosphatase (non-canonical NTP hydrolase)
MSNNIPFGMAPHILKDYAAFVESRRKKLDHIALDLHHMTTGMAGESGEALDVTKKLWIYEQHLHTIWKDGRTARAHLLEEMGDTVFYIVGACNLLGINLLDLITENQAKLTLRYPTGYTNAAALQRADKTGDDDRATAEN